MLQDADAAGGAYIANEAWHPAAATRAPSFSWFLGQEECERFPDVELTIRALSWDCRHYSAKSSLTQIVLCLV